MSETPATATATPTTHSKPDRTVTKNSRRRHRNKVKSSTDPSEKDSNQVMEDVRPVLKEESVDKGASSTANNPLVGKKKKKKSRRKKVVVSSTTNTSSTKKTPMVDLQLPTLKVTIRNIAGDKMNAGDVSSSSSSSSSSKGVLLNMIQMLRDMVQVHNQQMMEIKATDSIPVDSHPSVSSTHIPLIVLDEPSIQKILNRLDDATKKEDAEQEQAEKVVEETEKSHSDHTKTKERTESTIVDSNTKDSPESNPVDKRNNIVARVLYLVPYRKSKRRGWIPGNIYLVLNAPIPPFYQEKLDQVATTTTTTTTTTKSEKSVSEITTNIQSMSIQDDSNAKGEANDSMDKVDSKASEKENVITSADKSKAMAQARILLENTVESLSKICKASSSTNDQTFSGVKVIISQSQKVWKDHPKRGSRESMKYENTIETDPDFQKFLETKRITEEERMKRPKPPPGGGIIPSSTTGTTNNGEENAEPVAAVIVHLRNQQAAEERAKEEKKMSKKAAAKSKKRSEARGVSKKRSEAANKTNEAAVTTNKRSEAGGTTSQKISRKKPGKRALKRLMKEAEVSTPKEPK